MTWLSDDLTMFVYALLDRDGRVGYIGITVNLKTRRRVHRITSSQAYRGNERMRSWIREHGCNMLPLERVFGVRAARAREAHWMDVYRRLGCCLMNQAGMPRQPTIF